MKRGFLFDLTEYSIKNVARMERTITRGVENTVREAARGGARKTFLARGHDCSFRAMASLTGNVVRGSRSAKADVIRLKLGPRLRPARNKASRSRSISSAGRRNAFQW